MAADLRRKLNAEVDMVRGHYGEFKVLVDGHLIVDAGSAAFLGVLPSRRKILAAVRPLLCEQG